MGIAANQSNLRRNANTKNNEPRSSSSVQLSSADKPTYQKIGKNSLKKIRFHSKSCEDASKQERIFLKLDPKNPQHVHKIQQRRKAVTKGKNTIGYDVYCRSIPKEKRQKRSMVTPSTPDHTLDIPNKKWNGMVRSWRVALHRYDPIDLQQSFAAAHEAAVVERQKISRSFPAEINNTGVTVKEIEVAKSGVLNLVEVTTNSNYEDGNPNSPSQNMEFLSQTTQLATEEVQQPISCITPEDDHKTKGGGMISELDRWEAARRENEDTTFFSEGDVDDSDDDLL